MNDMVKNLIFWFVITIILMSIFQNFRSNDSNNHKISYSTFLSEINANQIREVIFDGHTVKVIKKDSSKYITYVPVRDFKLLDNLLIKNIKVVGELPEEPSLLISIFISWFPMLLLIGVWIFFMRQMQIGGGKGAMSFGKSKARMLSEDQIQTTFADVAGCDEAKEEVSELVEYLKEPSRFQKLGGKIPKGILMVGPPGTGKTLIARQIGKMLNAREPKVINGPEVLNKFVGQSEENIRKLFADAEQEQREKGDESGLHIIIFDELDAVCKQRGSGAGGGTGVGDSVVNQLLTKLDGVDQLNNILLIGMTNRKDMIDEALLRSGRLEVHMEISLPDEHGRAQILKIHTSKMVENDIMGHDVDLQELAKLTRNFSGAEINGLVKSASSFAMQRHIKVGTVAAIDDSIIDMKVMMPDFLRALDEVKPLFGVSEEDLQRAVEGGIIPFSDHIDKILRTGGDFIKQVKSNTTPLLSVLVHGPRGAGKTALAARIAMDSEFPFIKLVRPVDMIGMNEMQKILHLQKVFTDAYKSPLNILVLDDIDLIIDWVPIGPRFSSSVLAAIKGLMKNKPPQGRPLLIFGTTSEKTVLQQLQLDFQAQIAVPNVNSQDQLAKIMQHSGIFSDSEIRGAIADIAESTGGDQIGVGVQRVLLGIQTAMQDENRATRFAEVMADAIAEG